MVDILIKNVSTEVHKRLKDAALRHHRSITKEALRLIEEGLLVPADTVPLKPLKGTFPITGSWLKKTIREGRR